MQLLKIPSSTRRTRCDYGGDGNDLTLDPTVKTGSVDINDFSRHPKIRRWDHVAPARPNPVLVLSDDGAIQIKEGDPWIPLEDGLEIQFEQLPAAPHQYRTGDYWLIPARVLLPPPGQIEYPNNQDYSPTTFLEPHGVQHHYAPLAYWDGTKLSSLRRTFGTL